MFTVACFSGSKTGCMLLVRSTTSTSSMTRMFSVGVAAFGANRERGLAVAAAQQVSRPAAVRARAQHLAAQVPFAARVVVERLGVGRGGGSAPGAEGRNMEHFCLRIDPFDPDAVARHLRAHGIEPGETASRFGADGQGPSIYLEDPEGNRVELKGPPFE